MQTASDRYRQAGEKASVLAEQGRETVDRVRSAAAAGVDEVRRFAKRSTGPDSAATADPQPSDS